MSESLPDGINIFLTVDVNTINDYFNSNDPAPIYKRLLSQQLEEYIRGTVASAKRYSVIFYKFKCNNELDKQYAQPLMYAIRRHYSLKMAKRKKEFERFKVRSWALLAVSVAVGLITQGFVPMLIDSGAGSGSSMEEQKDIDGDGHADIVTSSKKGTYIFLTRGYKKSKKKKWQ